MPDRAPMITATVTVDDYIAAHRLHYARARGIMYGAGALLLVVGIAIAMSGVKWAAIVVFAGIGGVLGRWWESRFGLPNKVRKLYDQYKGISEPASFSWNGEEIEGRSAAGYGKRKWRDYVRLKECDDVFLLYVTDQLWHVYPKRWFVDQAQLEEFRRYARTARET